MTMPTVSVLIPTYNRADMVCEAIQSVLDQTYQDFEIVVVDDGSTDDTRQVIQAFADDRIRYFYQENQGRPAARNHTLREARGQYITFLDSDDLYLPDKLEKQVAFMEANPQFGMSYTLTERVLVDGTPIDTLSTQLTGKIHRQLLHHCSIATPSVMIRRAVIETVGEFDPFLLMSQDIDYWLRIAQHHEIGLIAEVLVRVRLKTDENLVRDPEKVLKYIPYIMKKNSREYSFFFRRRLLAHTYLVNGLALLNQQPQKLGRAWRVFWRGVLYWPLSAKMPLYLSRLLFRSLIPNGFQRWLRALWQRSNA